MGEIIVESVAPRDIYIRLLFPMSRLDQLLEMLSKCKVEYNSEDEPETAAAVQYVEKEFFPQMEKLIGEIKDQYGS